MSSAVFVVWRESVEALLVIALLYRCLSVRFERREVLRVLGLGVGLGAVIAVILAFLMQYVSDDADAERLDYVQLGLVLAAAALIVYTVLWLHRQNVNLKQHMQQQLDASHQRAGLAGVVLVTTLAVAREGAETVLFLYGIAMAQGGAAILPGALLGGGLALLTYGILTRAGAYLSWPLFFRVSTTVLLLLAGALLVDGSDRAIGLGLIPPGLDPVFDVSAWLDDGSGAGQWLATLMGYRARPALTTLLAFSAYWVFIALTLRPRRA